jgi:peptidoglycan biosynthesis protein MviN/MurJ (putative lipid II flippase)
MLISVFCLAVNALLALVLMSRWRQMGLGVANTLSAVINVSLLFYALRRKLKTLEMADVRRHLPALLGATLVAGGIAWGLAALWEARLGHGTFALRLGELLVPMTVATAAYFGLAVWLKTGYTEELIGLVRARLGRQKIGPTDSNSTTNGHE